MVIRLKYLIIHRLHILLDLNNLNNLDNNNDKVFKSYLLVIMYRYLYV